MLEDTKPTREIFQKLGNFHLREADSLQHHASAPLERPCNLGPKITEPHTDPDHERWGTVRYPGSSSTTDRKLRILQQSMSHTRKKRLQNLSYQAFHVARAHHPMDRIPSSRNSLRSPFPSPVAGAQVLSPMTSAYMCIYIYIHTHVHTYTYIYMYTHVYVYWLIYSFTCVYFCMCRTYIYILIYIYISVCVFVRTYIYIYLFRHAA